MTGDAALRAIKMLGAIAATASRTDGLLCYGASTIDACIALVEWFASLPAADRDELSAAISGSWCLSIALKRAAGQDITAESMRCDILGDVG